jgi:hypothetical protein
MEGLPMFESGLVVKRRALQQPCEFGFLIFEI